MSDSRSSGNGCSSTASRICFPTTARRSTSSMSSPSSNPSIRSARPPSTKRRYASAVVANPSGTRTPRSDRDEIISPSDEFFPPTCSRSARPRSANQRTLSPLGVRWPALVSEGEVMLIVEAPCSVLSVVSVVSVVLGGSTVLTECSSCGSCAMEVLEDAGRRLLRGLRGRADRRDAVRAERQLGPLQLPPALLDGAGGRVPRVRAHRDSTRLCGNRAHLPPRSPSQLANRGRTDDRLHRFALGNRRNQCRETKRTDLLHGATTRASIAKRCASSRLLRRSIRR